MNQNANGGQAAADELQTQIKQRLPSLELNLSATKILVRVYADMKALQRACLNNSRMKTSSSIQHFAQGFNHQALFDFVDVGVGKERADYKIRGKVNIIPFLKPPSQLTAFVVESFEFFVSNLQCKHIFFGACHDAGYAPFLEKFVPNPSVRKRITLLQGPNSHQSIVRLGFTLWKLETVFASPRLLTDENLYTTRSPLASSHVAHPFTAETPPASVNNKPTMNPAALSEKLGPIFHNQDGQRVDKILNIDSGSSCLKSLRHKKLCAWFYLRGKCERCHWDHGAPPLTATEFDYLWYIAR